jgi:hypothetical protein
VQEIARLSTRVRRCRDRSGGAGKEGGSVCRYPICGSRTCASWSHDSVESMPASVPLSPSLPPSLVGLLIVGVWRSTSLQGRYCRRRYCLRDWSLVGVAGVEAVEPAVHLRTIECMFGWKHESQTKKMVSSVDSITSSLAYRAFLLAFIAERAFNCSQMRLGWAGFKCAGNSEASGYRVAQETHFSLGSHCAERGGGDPRLLFSKLNDVLHSD